jgi:hypothetical protein
MTVDQDECPGWPSLEEALAYAERDLTEIEAQAWLRAVLVR